MKLDELLKFDGVGRNVLELRVVALVRLVRAMLRFYPSFQQAVDDAVERQLADEGRR